MREFFTSLVAAHGDGTLFGFFASAALEAILFVFLVHAVFAFELRFCSVRQAFREKRILTSFILLTPPVFFLLWGYRRWLRPYFEQRASASLAVAITLFFITVFLGIYLAWFLEEQREAKE